MRTLGGEMTNIYGEQYDYSKDCENDPYNKLGVLATFYDHSYYVERLSVLPREEGI